MDSRSQDDTRTPSPEPTDATQDEASLLTSLQTAERDRMDFCESADYFTPAMLERMFVAAVARGEAA